MTDGCVFSSCSSIKAVAVTQEQGPQQANPPVCHRPRRRRRRSLRNHNIRPKSRTGSWMSMHTFAFLVLLSILACCCQRVEADKPHGHFLGRRELLFDKTTPPKPPTRLVPRQENGRSSSDNNDSTGIATDEPDASMPTPLPQPFDTVLGNNFTSPSCPNFFHNFLHNQTFTDCLPLSLLLQTSSSFFTATRSPVRLTQTLDATCNVPYQACSALMASLARQIQLDENCGADLALGNPMATQAYTGLIAYPPLYHAGCLKEDSDSATYCFTKAVTNTASPSSSYIYYLPLGVQLPGDSQPACTTCLKNTMAVFATHATQPLSTTYPPASQQLDMTCGPTFVETVAPTSSSSNLRAVNRLAVLTGISLFCFLC